MWKRLRGKRVDHHRRLDPKETRDKARYKIKKVQIQIRKTSVKRTGERVDHNRRLNLTDLTKKAEESGKGFKKKKD